MNRTVFIREILFIVLIGYFSQGLVYPQGSLLGKAFLFGLLLISFLYFLRTLLSTKNKELFFYVWTLFLIMNFVGFVVSGNYSDSISSGMIRNILLTFLIFYPFYFFSSRGFLRNEHLLRFFLIMLPIVSLKYFIIQDQLLAEIQSSKSDVINNAAYTFVFLLPFIFLYKKYKILGLLSFFVILFFIIQSAKRSALLIAIIIFILYFFYQMKSYNNKHVFIKYFLGITMFFVCVFYIYNYILDNEFLIYRINAMVEGSSSGRDVIFSKLFQNWINSNSILRLLFGFGFASSPSITGGSVAHNDWLELLTNFGLLGVLLFFVLIILIFNFAINKSLQNDDRFLMISLIIILLLLGFSSRWYSSTDGYTISILLGFLFGGNNTINFKIVYV